MTDRTADAKVELVARAIADHFVARFGAKIEEDNTHIGVTMFDPPVPFHFNAANVARAAIAALEASADAPTEAWRPIETAPPETRIMLWCPERQRKGEPPCFVFGNVVQFSDGQRRVYGDGMNGDWLFTHWMPLPAPPGAAPTAPVQDEDATLLLRLRDDLNRDGRAFAAYEAANRIEELSRLTPTAPVQDDDAELVTWLRGFSPNALREGERERVLQAADRIEALSRLTPTADHSLVEALSDDECTICGKMRSQHNTGSGVGVCQIYPVFRSRRAAFSALHKQALAALAGKQSVEGQGS
jgi:hypothetical protein